MQKSATIFKSRAENKMYTIMLTCKNIISIINYIYNSRNKSMFEIFSKNITLELYLF